MKQNLALKIAQCEDFCTLIKNNTNNTHGCSKIIDVQLSNKEVKEYHLPEPFSGDIYNAPILFLSSNPSISHSELYPTDSWPDNMITDFFVNRFKQREEDNSWVHKNKPLKKSGERGKSVRYWSSINKRAEELLNRKAIAGEDYCITEIVHCKSEKEVGVSEAQNYCSDKFLKDMIKMSGAKVIIGIGKFVKNNLKSVDKLHGKPIYYLPHPNAFEKKTFAKVYEEKELKKIKDFLKDFNKECKRDLSKYDLPMDEEVMEFIAIATSYKILNKIK